MSEKNVHWLKLDKGGQPKILAESADSQYRSFPKAMHALITTSYGRADSLDACSVYASCLGTTLRGMVFILLYPNRLEEKHT